MQIVVDSDIWNAQTLFAPLGEVVLLPGREICADHLQSADALIVRSVTRVNEALLAQSPVRFVGTATSGIDHVDLPYLHGRNTAFASAEGCNARPVVEYVLACLFEWRRRTERSFESSTLGVIGCGRIGHAVAEWGSALGMRVLISDPPLERRGQCGFCELGRLLVESDILTLHVPLTTDGPDATNGLMNPRLIGQIPAHAWVINAARGGVIVEPALIAAIDANRLGGAILDVWTGEPLISDGLLRAGTLLTPHIAGYSAAAHRRAAQRIAAQLSQWAHGQRATLDDASASTRDWASSETSGKVITESDLPVIEDMVCMACDVRAIDAEYRRRLRADSPQAAFDAVRSACRSRLELTEVKIKDNVVSASARRALDAWKSRPNHRPGLW